MKNTVHDLSDYTFRKDDVLLLDTNVWLYLNPAPSDKSLVTFSLSRQYSEAFKSMRSASERSSPGPSRPAAETDAAAYSLFVYCATKSKSSSRL